MNKKQALQIIRQECSLSQNLTEACEYLIPELKEENNRTPTDDEIRNFIHSLVQNMSPDNILFSGKIKKNNCLKWIEKQQQTNNTTEQDAKFRKGQWIAPNCPNPHYVLKIEDINDDCVTCRDQYGLRKTILTGFSMKAPSKLDDNYHPWTIRDAVKGDVLTAKDTYNREYVFIFNELDYWRYETLNAKQPDITACCCINTINNHTTFHTYMPEHVDTNSVRPADKQQRESLFEKIKENGYEWNKQLKQLMAVIKKNNNQ